MFEIGSSLRQARERQGLALADVEQGTRIRSAYLAALEEERFHVLPAEVYAKAFLRTYADFLGLDGGLFANEFEARMEASRPSPPPPPEHRLALPSFDRRFLAALALGGATLLAGLLAWRYTGAAPPDMGAGTRDHPATATATNATAPKPHRHRPPARAQVRLTAARGDCWLSVRAGSRDGRVLYEGMVATGDSQRFVGRRFWIRMGAPWNLDVSLNKRPVRTLPRQTSNVLVTRAGLRPAL